MTKIIAGCSSNRCMNNDTLPEIRDKMAVVRAH